MKTYQIICMSFDGEYQIEHPEFNSIDDAWNYSNDLGSKWYFYPFHFVISNKTIKDAIAPLEFLINKRIKTVSEVFNIASGKEENKNLDVIEYAYCL